MKTPKLTKDLERKPAKWMTTAEAAEALMRTLELKYCCCGQWMPWRLDAGQKPVGYVKPVVEPKNEKGLHKLETPTTEEKDND